MLSIVISVVLLLVGFAALIKGADVLVDASAELGKRLGISELIIGLTIVAFGTSLPEMIVNILANAEGAGDLAIGNIIGSNIANVLLILGIASLIRPLRVTRVTVWREILFAMGAGLILVLLVADEFLAEGFVGLDRIDGIMLIVLFALFLYYSFGRSQTNVEQAEEELGAKENYSFANTFMLIVIGLLGLGIGGELIVRNATSLAELIGISGGVVGLTIVALGTSAPELAASISAVRKGKTDLAVGNVVGSNLFNTFWVLGLNAAILPLAFSSDLYFDVAYAAFAVVVFFGLMAFGRPRHAISKYEGMVLLSLYGIYIASLVVRA